MVEALRLHRLFPGLRLNLHRTPLPTALTPVPAISGACMFLRREAYWRIGGFDEGYFLHVEDLDLCLRFRRGGGEILFAPDVVVRHLGGTSAAPKATVERHKARSFRRYFRRNFPTCRGRPAGRWMPRSPRSSGCGCCAAGCPEPFHQHVTGRPGACRCTRRGG